MSFNKIAHSFQLAGIETATLNEGRSRNTRVAHLHTGSGLHYQVVIDRGMDISWAFYRGHSLCWLSHAGVMPPEPSSIQNTEWLTNFGGGLLTTCGLDHTGPPENTPDGPKGLHGPYSNLPATLTRVNQPDPLDSSFSIEGEVLQTRVFGPTLKMTRRISGNAGQNTITIQDSIVNLGNESAPHMILYHINLGWPLVDEGSQVFWKGEIHAAKGSDAAPKPTKNGFICPPPVDVHSGASEKVQFIRPYPANGSLSECGVYNPELNMMLLINYDPDQLPWLTSWQHFGRKEYVTALEPCSSPPWGTSQAREQDTMVYLEPGQEIHYDTSIRIVDEPKQINAILNNTHPLQL